MTPTTLNLMIRLVVAAAVVVAAIVYVPIALLIVLVPATGLMYVMHRRARAGTGTKETKC